MSWTEQVFRYCERGQDPAFWAEPFNAMSNAGYLVAAALLWRQLAPQGGDMDDGGHSSGAEAGSRQHATLALLTALVAAVGIGSFLFHTFATRWSRAADVAPIGVFMMIYFHFALRTFLGWSGRRVGIAMACFLGATLAASTIACPASVRSVADFAREPCLKGAMGYVPAFFALIATGAMMRRHPAIGRCLLAAGLLFLGALVLRWLDRDVCAATRLLGQVRGTHALWHLLTAAMLYVLVATAIDVVVGSSRATRGR